MVCVHAISGVALADDRVTLADVYRFLQQQPYRIVAIQQPTDWAHERETFTERFLTAKIGIGSRQIVSSDTTLLLRSLIEVDTFIVFTHVPIASDSAYWVQDANGISFSAYETDSPWAPDPDSAAWLVERINQYGLILQQYNRLRATREDTGGYTQIALSGVLVALGLYGMVEGDEGGKIAGGLALLASPFAIVSSVRQIEDDRRREKKITELVVQLRIAL